MAAGPHGALVGRLRQEGVAMHWMVCAHVVQPVARLERRDDELVHRDVLAIELDPADAVGHVGLPPNLAGGQVE